ncbi:MAG: glycoside hydrolase family 2 TIM barrel-domain containing protein [Niabella sp.]
MSKLLMSGIVAGMLILGNVHAQTSVNAYMPTPWTHKTDKAKPLNEYPRPQMVRSSWQNLNGAWQYAITDKDSDIPGKWEGEIIVPFPMESYLSGVQKRIDKTKKLWYQKNINIQKRSDRNVLLHIGACDWQTRIYVNGKEIVTHEGGYIPIEQNITAYLNNGKNSIIISCWDPTDEGEQARGKQVSNPSGIYYTSVTGIWQTVWIEQVPKTYIKDYNVVTDIDHSTVTIQPEIVNPRSGDQYIVSILRLGKLVTQTTFSDTAFLKPMSIPGAKLWSPDQPDLYDLQLTIKRNNKVVDQVKGYFGMRKIAVAKDENGVQRIFLNNKPVFMYGPLDQGYWPDGIYTAPTEAALVSDIKRMKEMGFNTVRKHVKVEPSRWYYHCDVLGLLVWQDMPSGYGEIVPVKDHEHSIEGNWLARHYKDVERTEASEQVFRSEWAAIIRSLKKHPSIVVWVPFNESWGQFKTNEMLSWTKTLDPTRLVDGPSGWIDRGEGEMRDYHLYGERLDQSFPLEDRRSLVIGEFGGLGLAIKNHTMKKDSWGYSNYTSEKELLSAYIRLVDRIEAMKKDGFSAAIYTQLTDVETEINGIITYDRYQLKMPAASLKAIHEKLYK